MSLSFTRWGFSQLVRDYFSQAARAWEKCASLLAADEGLYGLFNEGGIPYYLEL